MKKLIIISLLFSLISFSVYAKEIQKENRYSVEIAIAYGHGFSDFFESTSVTYNYDGKTFQEDRENTMGFSFLLNVNIPLAEKITLIPGLSFGYGFQDYLYQEVSDSPQAQSESKSYNFNMLSGNMLVSYSLWKVNSDISFSLLGGLSYNIFNADNGFGIEDGSYLGAVLGGKFDFMQKSQYDLVAGATYNHAFKSEMPSFIRAYIGLKYKF